MDLQPALDTPCITLAWQHDGAGQVSAKQTVREMSRHSCGPHGHASILGGDDELAWAVRVPSRPSPLTGWSVYSSGNELCIVEGDFYEDPPGQSAAHGELPGLAEAIASQLCQDPNRRVTGLFGIWAGVYVDAGRETAYLFGDLTGTRAIFWHASASDFIVCSSLWAFRACDRLDRQCDTMMLNQWLTLGIPLAGRTWFRDVRILQRGQQVRAMAGSSTKIVDQVQHYKRQTWSHDRSVQELRDATDATLQGLARRTGDDFGIGLSGGLDSRILLASLHSQGLRHRAITFCGSERETDNVIAGRCADLTKTTRQVVVLDNALATSLIPDSLLLNQGESRGYASLLMGIAAAKDNLKAILIGYPADLFAGHPVGGFDLHSLRSVEELSGKLLSMYHTWLTGDDISLVLASELRVPWNEVMHEWRSSLDVPHTSIQDLYMDHIFDYRCQRRTGPRLDQSRPFCTAVFPYVDERLYSVYRQLPFREIVEERAHIALLCSYQTGLENIPSAAKAFLRIPLKHEFRARPLVNLGRAVRSAILRPARQQLRRWKYSFSPPGLTSAEEQIFDYLAHHAMFDAVGIRRLTERARQGRFSTAEILQQMRCATLLYDFLFGDGLPGSDQLKILKPVAELSWTTWPNRPSGA